jgi:3-hydroxybutyryl-CoA dehydrogenase
MKVAIIGTGQMGRGIAQCAAQAGWDVMLLNASLERAIKGFEKLRGTLHALEARGKVDATALLERIEVVGRLDALRFVDVIVECVPEQMSTKIQVLSEVSHHNVNAIIATNTSSLSVTALGAGVLEPTRFVGVHFFNPVPRMKLAEIVRGLSTSDRTLAEAEKFVRELGKEPVHVKDGAGFIVNRILFPMLNEACAALQEGVASIEDIDAAATLGLNHPMGPLQLMDLIGLDTCLAILEAMHRETGEPRHRPCPLLRQYVRAGRLGRKSGRGFYDY